MADMKRIKGRIAETIYPNGQGAITAEAHQALLLEMVDEINSKKQDTIEGGAPFSEQGNYPDLSAGFAENLVGRGESVPAEFTFRASGGKSIKDGAARIKRIKGNSVVWNQKIDKVYVDGDKTLVTREGESMISGHKYLLNRSVAKKECYVIATEDFYDYSIYEGQYSKIFTNAYDCVSDGVYPSRPHIYCTGECGYVQLVDLTLMFGAGNEPTTIEEYEARKPIVADEYAYNEGQVIHCNTASIKSVGDNAWDEQWEEGIVDNGNNYFLQGFIRSKNYIKVIGGEEYYYANARGSDRDYLVISYYDEDKNYLGQMNAEVNRKFTMPANAHYMRFYVNDTYGTVYNNDILISLYHSGWKAEKDDQYQPYWQDILPLPIIRKYFPQGMKSAGSAHDEIRYNKASGKWEKVVRIGSVDLGTFDYNLDSRFDNAQFYATSSLINTNIRCGRYVTIEGGWDTNKDKTITRTSGGQILIVDSAYTDAASFKAAMQGVILYYEIAEPVIREIDEPIGTDYRVADFGTEQAISSIPSAPFSADIIYQFNAVDMIREHELEITELQSIIATMQAQLTSLINGGQ